MAISCADRLESEARILAQIDPNDTGAVRRFFELQEKKPGLTDKFMEMLYNAMLSGLPTQVAILLETGLVNTTTSIERGLASGVGAIRQAITGSLDKAERYTMSDVGTRAAGSLYSVRDRDLGMLASTMELAKVWQKGFSDTWNNIPTAHFNTSHPVRGTIGVDPDSTKVAQVLGKLIRVPSAMISGTDAMMQEVGKRSSLWEQASIAYKRAEKAGQLDGKSRSQYISDFINNPNQYALSEKQMLDVVNSYHALKAMGMNLGKTELEHLKDTGKQVSLYRAIQEGQRVNFTSKPSPFINSIIRVVDKFDKMGMGIPFARMLVPFINTPANIFRWVFERVPGMGLMFKETQRELTGGKTFGEILKRLPPDQISSIKEYTKMDFDNVVARQTFGMSLIAAAMYLEGNGYVSAGPAIDPEKRTTQTEAGYEPYSYKIGDRVYKYTRPDSIGLLIGMGADFNRLIRTATNQDDDFKVNLENALHAAGLMVGYNLVEKTWASNLGLFFQMATDPERYAKRFAQQMAGMPIPAIVKHVNDAIDPEQRQMLSILDALKNKSGIGRSDLPQAVNITGDPKHIGQPMGPLGDVEPTDLNSKIYDFAIRMVSPYRGTELSQNPLMRVMADLGMPTKKVSDEIKLFPEVKDDLTQDQYEYYAKTKGQILSNLGNRMLENIPNFNELPTIQQKKALSTILSAASTQAKNLLIAQYPDLYLSQAERFIKESQKVKQPYSEPIFRR